ncbi:type II secretion system secretin GspD [Telmatospirillum sp.]|uniref:type II secretion system secretin GspD n=1 Tax=Telmatospirillum sp. TaxID=2079197 RepID=UPI002848F1FB|nr:type II secretion system secretin GspD [Telmatospirillum sp.]MDR3436835.1 type II secretion system secretin GspD [Telmatospirillum sp.]
MSRRTTSRLTAALLVSVMSGCQQWQGLTAPAPVNPPVSATPPAVDATDIPPAGQKRQSGLVQGRQDATSEPLVQLGREAAVSSPARTQGAAATGDDISLNFVDTDIREVARNILGGILKVNYTIDPNVHGTATYETTTPLPRSALIPTLTMLLNQNGATLVQRDGAYWVLPSNLAAATGALPGHNAATAGSEVVPLRYASAAQLAHVLEPYTAETGRIVADPTHNALLVSGDGGARTSLVALIHAFDIDILANQSYALFPVSSGEPSKAAAELQKVLATEGDGRLAGMVRVVPMERTNAVLVISSQPRYIADVRRLYGLLDKAQSVTARNWYVYYVQNGDSSDLEKILQRAFTPGKVTSSDSGRGSTAPNMETVSLKSSNSSSSGSSSSSNSNSNSNSNSSGTNMSPTGGQQTADKGQAATESLSASSDQGDDAAAKTDSMRIIGNSRSNSILIYATPSEYGVVESMLAKIDVLPLQVMIEATIAEVTLTDDLKYGTQFYFKNGGLNGELSTLSSSSTSITSVGTSTFGGTYPAFVLNKTSGAVKATLSALQDITQVKVLSSPQLLVLDNHSAQLIVGNEVPVITQSATYTSTSVPSTVNSVDYHSTGVILQVLPRVNSGGLVTLDISQEVSDVVTTTSSKIDSPTFQQRKVKSRVVVQDGQTVGLAGLIRDTASNENSGLPWLKDIPLLGSLVSTQDNTRTRTELLILLTPRVVQDQRDARALTDDLRAKLSHANLVPVEKAALKASGSSDPNAEMMQKDGQ